MPTIPEIFALLPSYFVPGAVSKDMTIYFSLDDYKYTVTMTATDCKVEEGKTVENAVFLKTTADMFTKMVMENYTPGMKEVMTGALKTNNPGALMVLKKAFKFPAKA